MTKPAQSILFNSFLLCGDAKQQSKAGILALVLLAAYQSFYSLSVMLNI